MDSCSRLFFLQMLGQDCHAQEVLRLSFLLSCLLGATTGSLEDANFKRHSTASESEVLSKQVARQVRCEVCVLASKLIVEHLENRTFKREYDLLEVVSSTCKGDAAKEKEPIDRVLEKSGWSVENDTDSATFKLVQHEHLNKDTTALHQVEGLYTPLQGGELSRAGYKRDGLQEACLFSVSGYQSEITEYIFKRLAQNHTVDDEVVAKKLCLELSRSCLDKNPRNDNAEEYNGPDEDGNDREDEGGDHDAEGDDQDESLPDDEDSGEFTGLEEPPEEKDEDDEGDEDEGRLDGEIREGEDDDEDHPTHRYEKHDATQQEDHAELHKDPVHTDVEEHDGEDEQNMEHDAKQEDDQPEREDL